MYVNFKGTIPYVWGVIGAIPWYVVVLERMFRQGMKLQQQQGAQMHEYVALAQTKSGFACQEKAWHAHEPYVNACGCSMKSWTRNGIASQI